MNVAPIGGITPNPTTGAPREGADTGFGDLIASAIENVSKAEAKADAIATDIATGGSASVHELMVAMTEATLGVELMVQIRNKAIEAYQEIMRIQV